MVSIKSSGRYTKSSFKWIFICFGLIFALICILSLQLLMITSRNAKSHLVGNQNPVIWTEIKNNKYSFNPVLRQLGFDSDTLYDKILKSHPNPTASHVVIEVGCFRLDQSMAASALGFRTLSLDASPLNFQKMKEQFERLPDEQKSRMELYPKAVSDKSGKILEFASIGGTGDHAVGVHIDQGNAKYVNNRDKAVVQVETVALDDLIMSSSSTISSVFLLKVDVQGHEASVFRGLSKSIKGGKIRYILFEYWVDALDQASKQDFGSCTAVKDILIPLVDAGYDLFDLSVSAHPKAGTKVTHAYTQRYYRPLDFKANCHWFASRGAADRKAMVNNGEEPYTMGYWTDILAVYKGELMIV